MKKLKPIVKTKETFLSGRIVPEINSKPAKRKTKKAKP